MKSVQLFLVIVSSLALALSASAGSMTQVNIAGSSGLEGLGAFTGMIQYDSNDNTTGLLDISLTNTSPSAGGKITGLVFNIAGNASAAYQPISGDAFAHISNASTSPFGTFEFGAVMGGSFLGGGSPNAGIHIGDSRTFRFNITGLDVASLTASSFISELSTGGSQSASFLVRFRGFDNDGSDKVPGTPNDDPPPGIPTPATFGAGLALMSLMSIRRRHK